MMTLGNMRGPMLAKTFACLIAGCVLAANTSYAQRKPDRTITCTGLTIDVGLRPNAWALAVIYDAAGGYTCTIDRAGAGHDPMRPCSAGEKCRLVGIYSRKIDTGYSTTYVIDRINSLDTIEERR